MEVGHKGIENEDGVVTEEVLFVVVVVVVVELAAVG